MTVGTGLSRQRSPDRPIDALPILPFLFITIACGAVSGFHCLVSSGTSSKQVARETDAQYVGYGAMLLEGALAVIVILACCAGVGMGKFEKNEDGRVRRSRAELGRSVRRLATALQAGRGLGRFQAEAQGRRVCRRGAQFPDRTGHTAEAGRSP